MIFSRLVEDYGNERQIKGSYLYAIFEIQGSVFFFCRKNTSTMKMVREACLGIMTLKFYGNKRLDIGQYQDVKGLKSLFFLLICLFVFFFLQFLLEDFLFLVFFYFIERQSHYKQLNLVQIKETKTILRLFKFFIGSN